MALATFYLLLQADFLAAAQVIVYAGAVMIMFLFVTAYLGGRADEPTRERPVWQTAAALIAAAALVAEVMFAVGHQNFPQGAVRERRLRLADRRSAPSFLGRYLLAFEATSILLMVAAVGGVMLATRGGPRRAAPTSSGAFEVRAARARCPAVQSR